MRAVLAGFGGLAVLGVALWMGASPAGAVAPSAEAGGELAARWCAACHVVAPSGAGTDAAPSFAAIANQRSSDQIRNFLAEPHARPMRGFKLTRREIEDVTAYIATQKAVR